MSLIDGNTFIQTGYFYPNPTHIRSMCSVGGLKRETCQKAESGEQKAVTRNA